MNENRTRERGHSLPFVPPRPPPPPPPPEGWPGTSGCPPPTLRDLRRSVGIWLSRMSKVTAFNSDTTDGNTYDEEEQPPPRRGNHLKSCIDRTRAPTVLHMVTWPHEDVYTLKGKPATSQDLLIPLFIHGYLIIMDTEGGDHQETDGHPPTRLNVGCSNVWVGEGQNLP